MGAKHPQCSGPCKPAEAQTPYISTGTRYPGSRLQAPACLPQRPFIVETHTIKPLTQQANVSPTETAAAGAAERLAAPGTPRFPPGTRCPRGGRGPCATPPGQARVERSGAKRSGAVPAGRARARAGACGGERAPSERRRRHLVATGRQRPPRRSGRGQP